MVQNTEEKNLRKRKVIKIISYIILAIVVLWFSLVLIEMYRVKTDRKPLLCFNEIKDVEDDDEYSLTCYGILYKYREYHYNDSDALSAREFTLFFKEFERKIANK